jgi:hypothetical protein
MPRICTVCSHKSRVKIDKAIVFGRSNRAIASQFCVTRSAVQRHKRHVAAAIERATEKRELSIGQDILGRLEDLYRHGTRLLTKAETAKNLPAAIAALREQRGILGAVYEVAREAVPKSNVMVPSEEYVKAVNRALGIYPGAFVPLVDGVPTKPGSGESSSGAPAPNTPAPTNGSKPNWPPLLPESTDSQNENRILEDGLPVLP